MNFCNSELELRSIWNGTCTATTHSDRILICLHNVKISLQFESVIPSHSLQHGVMLPLPFRDFVSPHVVPRLRTAGFGLVLGLVLAFEVFIEMILEVDDAVLLTKTRLLFEYLSEKSISGKRLTLLKCKLSWRHYCLMNLPDPRPPLWHACDNQDIDAVKWLLSFEGMRDDPGFDGTTGFALSLAQLNTWQTLAILKSGIEPRNQILFLASEFTGVETSDSAMLALQKAVKKVLDRMPQPISVMTHSEDTIDER